MAGKKEVSRPLRARISFEFGPFGLEVAPEIEADCKAHHILPFLFKMSHRHIEIFDIPCIFFTR